MAATPSQLDSVLELCNHYFNRLYEIVMGFADERDNLRAELVRLRDTLEMIAIEQDNLHVELASLRRTLESIAVEQSSRLPSIVDPNTNDTQGISNFKELLREKYPRGLNDREMLRLATFSELSAEVHRRQNGSIGKLNELFGSL